MIDILLQTFRRLHMVGIGGSGMSGIAELLLRSGFQVTGSDLQENEATRRLRELGATVNIGHDRRFVNDAEVLVYSSAVSREHIELKAAREKMIPVIPRAEMLAELMRMKAGVAISGTHGKTTTTSLVGEVLSAGGLDPTVIVGGRLRKIGSGAVQGQGCFLVAEADEFDRSFLRLTPSLVVITNIDSDHLECYGSFQELENAFVQFAGSVPFYGRAIICLDDPPLSAIIPRIHRTVITYGFSPQADVRALDAAYDHSLSSFNVKVNGDKLGEVSLPIPGRHNILNALAAVAVGVELGLGFDPIREALQGFRGVHRRFEIIGEAGGVIVVDDFAHHPAEITATLSAAKSGWKRALLAVFQPHLFSRTQALAREFGRALLAAETVLVLPIYPARESPMEGVTSRLIVDAAREMGHKNIYYLEDRSQVASRVRELVKPGDLCLTLGAGDVGKLAPQILEAL